MSLLCAGRYDDRHLPRNAYRYAAPFLCALIGELTANLRSNNGHIFNHIIHYIKFNHKHSTWQVMPCALHATSATLPAEFPLLEKLTQPQVKATLTIVSLLMPQVAERSPSVPHVDPAVSDHLGSAACSRDQPRAAEPHLATARPIPAVQGPRPDASHKTSLWTGPFT